MKTPQQRQELDLLHEKLNNLEKVISQIQQQIQEIRNEITTLSLQDSDLPLKHNLPTADTPSFTQEPKEHDLKEILPASEYAKNLTKVEQEAVVRKEPYEKIASHTSSQRIENTDHSLERWLGENIINKIGMLILMLGVGIFVKYAIDNQLITELGRILLAYAASVTLLTTSYSLRKKYTNFSAVLYGGGIGISYFTTYFAYSFYGFLGQALTFGLMFVLTLYAVWEATRYDIEVIAIIGLVGAYAVLCYWAIEAEIYKFYSLTY